MSSKKGTTTAKAEMFKAKSHSQGHGQNSKNVVTGGRATAHPTSNGRTAPIKGQNRGGV